MPEVLVLGRTGGREHALGMGLANNGDVQVMFSDGNAGSAEVGTNLCLTDDQAVRWGIETRPEFVVVGPEAPLVGGVAGVLRHGGITTFGPGKKGAQLEGSKAWADGFMEGVNILRPESYITRDPKEALLYAVSNPPHLYVIKADGLAGGKGVVLPKTYEEAERVVTAMISGKLFGDAGKTIIFQERLRGKEVSMFAVLDGQKARVLFLAQDHKRLKNNDEGPNTGGMGAYSPVSETTVSPDQFGKMLETLEKTLTGLKWEGIDYRGVLYIGFMLAEEYGGDPTVIEYNVRFGDPEAQVILPRLQRAGINVHELFYEAACGGFEGDDISVIQQAGQAALSVCLAAGGYPDSPRKGETIYGLDGTYPDVIIHHGGTKRETDGRVVTAGGRVLYLTGLGETVGDAAKHAYAAIGKNAVHFDGMQYRSDIGWQALAA